jgi:hypothetical protein
MEDAETNRMFKNSVFTMLFGEKEKLLELYNAFVRTMIHMIKGFTGFTRPIRTP